MDRFRRPRRGFTLVEVLVAVTLAVALAGIALPSFIDWIAAQRHVGHAQHLAWSFNRARSEAIKRGFHVNVCKSADRLSCTPAGRWDGGFLLFVDYNRDGNIDPDEPVLRIEGPAPGDVRVSANRPIADYVSYTTLGQARLLSGALQMGTFIVCSSGRNEIHVVLANSGRARIDRTNVRCP